MGVLDEYQKIIKATFAKWVQITDYKAVFTLEDFAYETGVDEKRTGGCCWKCVSVNQCYFKDEENKKPQKFDYSVFKIIKLLPLGLYHPHCHCVENLTSAPFKDQIKIILSQGKIDFFFRDKLDWFYSWGYKDEDKQEFIQLIKTLSTQAYSYGNYEKVKHTKAGFQINTFITISGKNEKSGHTYNVKSCFIIFPNMQLRCVTLIGGRT